MPSPFEVKVVEESYEAYVTIKRHRVIARANANGYFDDPEKAEDRLLVDIKLSSTSLEGIVLKIKQHSDLVEDE